ncbi:MAG TPA: amino acid adenylation domain-containing protein, partial [Blastocatellia bacterium]|nr:amino acid adenylation domain-containing protein [Blastocatellia bacterium]
ERSPNLVLALLGIAKAGAAYLPLNPADPAHRVAFMLDDADVEVLLTQTSLMSGRPQSKAKVIDLESEWEQIRLQSGENFDSGATPENLAYVLYTSGSTGTPKGTLIAHRGLLNYLLWATHAYDLRRGSGAPLHSPITADLTLTSLFCPLLAGQPLCLLPEEFGLDALAAALSERRQWSLVKLTPAHLLWLNERLSPAAIGDCCRVLIVGGEALLAERLSGWRRLAPRTRLINEYGPTETVVGCCVYEVGEADAEAGAVAIGRPIANTRMYVLGGSGELVAVGQSGELVIGGAGVARGYLKRPELTAEKFVPDGYGEERGGRLYRSGDVGRYREDGVLEYEGRRDEQVKVRGYRVELGEVEAALSAVEGVAEAAVVAREGEGGGKRLVGYVVWREGVTGEVSEVKRQMRERVPEYMVPSVVVTMLRLPLSGNGKVNRLALPAPDSLRPEPEETYAEPRTAVEKVLARIWAKTLGIEKVGIHDNFFELGGDSILSIQVVSRANDAGLRLTAKQLFQNQTIAELAAVADAAPALAPAAEQGVVSGPVPLTPIQRWFFAQQLTDPHHFNQAVLLDLPQPLDPALLRQVFSHLIRHHDALRLRFSHRDGSWCADNAAVEAGDFFTDIDLSQVGEVGRDAAIEDAVNCLQASLDLHHGPMLRVGLLRLGPAAGQRLLIVIHHLSVDAVSWRILLEDLQRGYQQARRGEAIALGRKTTSFKQWAERLRQYAAGVEISQQAAYWQRQAQVEVAPLPVANAAGDNRVESEREVRVCLSREQTRQLLQEAPRAYHTQINELLLTALALAYEKWAGSKRLRVAMEGHGREEIAEGLDVSRTVGWFTTLYPLVLEVAGDDLSQQIKSIKEQVRAVPGKGLGYGLLKYEQGSASVGEAEGARPPEISFNYFGQGGEAVEQGGVMKEAGENSGNLKSRRQQRPHLLDVNGQVRGGQLELRWGYSEKVHERAQVEELAGRYVEALAAVIRHCLSEEAGGYTPSDFAAAELSQQELDEVVRGRGQIEDIYGLAPVQKGMLFHHLYAPDSGEYVIQTSIGMRGVSDIGQVERAWQEVIERHAALRSEFVWEGLREPVQIVRQGVQLGVEHLDLRGRRAEEQEEMIAEYMREDRRRGFDLASAPLMRMAVMRLAEESYRLILSHHHIVMDGWSSSIVMKQLMGAGGPSNKRRPYREYIEWLRRQDLSKAENYWRERLKGVQSPTRLAIAKNVSADAQTRRFAESAVKLDRETTARLQGLAREQNLTLNTVVEGAWALLMSRYSGNRDVVFGATVSGRPAELAGIEEMVGLFINTLPVRVTVEEGAEVGTWLRQLQQEQQEMREYEYSPLVEVQGWSEVARSEPLFESIFVFENYPVEQAAEEWGKRVGIGETRTQEQTNYPLTVTVAPGNELRVRMTYDASRYEGEAMERLAGHMGRILEEMAARPKGLVRDVEVLSEKEREQLLEEWNDTQQVYEGGECLHELIEAQAERTPDRVAVAYDDEQLTYDQLNRRANQLAHFLLAQGILPEQKVGLCLERGTDMVVALLGVLKSGAAYLPLDPAFPTQRLDFMLADAGVSFLLTQQSLRDLLPAPEARRLCLDEERAALAAYREDNPAAGVSAERLAYVLYTSGSTGKPKGVQIPHGAVVNFIGSMREMTGMGEGDRLLAVTTLSFDIAGLELYVPLAAGARLEVSSRQAAADGEQLRERLRERQVTVMQATPASWRMLLQAGWRGERQLRVLCGGEALPAELAVELERESEAAWNMYGPTETTIWSAVERLREAERGVTIGRPIANTQIYILDKQLRPAPVGVPGELYIGGSGVGRGYLGRYELTSDRFVPDPFSRVPGMRLYRTGDLARYLTDGSIEYLDRIDNQVKIRGFRIELGEIEAALMQHPGIAAAATVCQTVADDKRLVAYIVACTPGAPDGEAVAGGEAGLSDLSSATASSEAPDLSPKSLRSFLNQHLPSYMVPSIFVMLDALPRGLNGKLDRKALPAPEQIHSGSQDHFVAPRTPVEEKVAGIWAEVLGVERVGVDDNFFELGGHSLLAIRVASRLREAFQVTLSLRTLFERSTVADLAVSVETAIAAAEGSESRPIVPIGREGNLPLSFAQERLWFMNQLEPESAVYNIQTATRLDWPINRPAFEQSLTEVVRRHEALRTTFPSVDGRPVQRIAALTGFRLDVVELRHLNEADRAAVAHRLGQEQAQRPFDLARGPLLRVTLLRLGERDHLVVISMHHIVSDAWSRELFIKELVGLYEVFVSGKPSPFAELPIQYADYAAWQRGWLQGEGLEQQMAYWKQQLSGAPAMVDLPTDRPRPPVQSFRGATQSFSVSKAVTDQLKALSRSEGASLFMTLLGAFKTLLYRYTGQPDVVVGTPIDSRNWVQVEELIGIFVNTLAIRTSLSGNPSFREVIRHVRDVALGAYAHQEVPFEKLVEELDTERSLSHMPIYQVMFALGEEATTTFNRPGLGVRPMEIDNYTTKFDLGLAMTEGKDGLEGCFEYSTDLFDQPTVARIAGHFQRLLEAMSGNA